MCLKRGKNNANSTTNLILLALVKTKLLISCRVTSTTVINLSSVGLRGSDIRTILRYPDSDPYPADP